MSCFRCCVFLILDSDRYRYRYRYQYNQTYVYLFRDLQLCATGLPPTTVVFLPEIEFEIIRLCLYAVQNWTQKLGQLWENEMRKYKNKKGYQRIILHI